MIESVPEQNAESLRALAASLAWVDEKVTDADRIDQLAALEALKAAAAAAQVRVTVGFVASQEQVAQGWREHAEACSQAGDFDGWRQARDQACRASLDEPGQTRDGDTGQSDSSGTGRGGRSRKRPVVANGIAAQVALARAESPHRGGQHVTLALTLHRHRPHVMAWLAAGVLSEWRATLIVRECAVLAPELQEALDAELADTLAEGIGRLGDRQLTGHVKAIAYRLDPASVMKRAAHAESDRRVSLRPAPDTMAYLTALLPVAQAVAAHAALTQAADTARAAGDERGKGQVMADTLIERLTGHTCAEDVGVEVQVVITDGALFGDDDTPAQVPGYGTVPAGWVRNLLTPHDHDTDDTNHTNDTNHTDDTDDTDETGRDGSTPDPERATTGSDRCDRTGGASAATGRPTRTRTGSALRASEKGLREHARVWLRRLYTHPTTGQLIAMDSTRRVFDAGLRKYLLARDAGTCRTPWCDAPIRHLDHIHDHAHGGPTTATNGQGLCVRCNHTKQLPGFTAHTIEPESRQPGAPHTVDLTTPTGHTYRSTAPPLIPGTALRPRDDRTHKRAPDQPTTQPPRALPHQPHRRLEMSPGFGPAGGPSDPEAPQPGHHRGPCRVSGHRDDLGIQAIAPRGSQHHRLVRVVERVLSTGEIEPLTQQPPVMRAGPRLPAAVHDRVAQQQLGQAVSGPHQIRAGRFPGPDQVPGGLLLGGGDPHRSELIQAQQLGQVQGIAGVRLDPVPGRPLQLRGGHHLTTVFLARHADRVGEEGRSPMTEALQGMGSMPEDAKMAHQTG